MPHHTRKREVGRGERVLPGVWRLRLPLPWPGVPHCNAWAIAAGDGIVMVDTGMHEPGSEGHLDRALAQVNLKVETTRLLVCTHAHSDHYGQAATVVGRAGCPLWMHPDHEHMRAGAAHPDAALSRRVEVARQSGVPAAPLQAYAEANKGRGDGVAAYVAPDRDLLPGVQVHTDLGAWDVVETPGHAPSHVCLFQPERRLLLSGDHLLGRVSPYFDFGWSEDPAGEFLASLDRIEALDARLCLAGHGRTFTDVQGHIDANRALVHERVDTLAEILDGATHTAFEAVPLLFGAAITAANASWWLQETLCYLRHLEVTGRVVRASAPDEAPERWTAA